MKVIFYLNMIWIGIASISPCLNGQSIAPGGVGSPVLWYAAETDPYGQAAWVDQETHIPLPANIIHLDSLNFNPTVSFGENGIRLPVSEAGLSDASVFIVFTPGRSQEEIVWYANLGDTSRWVLTTDRMADLYAGYYIDLHQDKTAPGQYCYLHKSKNGEGSVAIDLLSIGNTRTNPPLPLQQFHGTIAEFVMYDRVLSLEERIRVESFLAIKYGTMLSSQGTALYRSAQGQELWNGHNQSQYNYRITGIGRDDAAGLLQLHSTSSYEPGVLTMSISTEQRLQQVPDASFLLWADDNGEMSALTPFPHSDVTRIERQWLVAETGGLKNIPTAMAIDRNALPSKIHTEESYWLIIDRTGNGTYHPEIVEILAGRMDSKTIVFDSLYWDSDGSGTDVFTIAKSDEIGILIDIDQPLCKDAVAGKLMCKVFAGTAPYQVMLTSPDGKQKVLTVNTNDFFESVVDGTGMYHIRVEDSKGRTTEQRFFIDHADGPEICIDDTYHLIEGLPLTLRNTCEGSHDRVTWYGSNDQISDTEITIHLPGTYTLQVERNGCITRRKVNVIAATSGIFESCKLYPNPMAHSEPLQLDVLLSEPGSLNMDVVDISGRILYSQQYTYGTHFSIRENIKLPAGLYYCRLESGSDQYSISFIVL